MKAALEAGELSLARAREIARAEAARPGSAAGLLGVAKGESLKTLKEEARDRRVRAVDPEELHRLQHEAQTLRHWRTGLGMVAFAGELPPEVVIPFINRLDAETDRLWAKARRRANPETHLAMKREPRARASPGGRRWRLRRSCGWSRAAARARRIRPIW